MTASGANYRQRAFNADAVNSRIDQTANRRTAVRFPGGARGVRYDDSRAFTPGSVFGSVATSRSNGQTYVNPNAQGYFGDLYRDYAQGMRAVPGQVSGVYANRLFLGQPVDTVRGDRAAESVAGVLGQRAEQQLTDPLGQGVDPRLLERLSALLEGPGVALDTNPGRPQERTPLEVRELRQATKDYVGGVIARQEQAFGSDRSPSGSSGEDDRISILKMPGDIDRTRILDDYDGPAESYRALVPDGEQEDHSGRMQDTGEGPAVREGVNQDGRDAWADSIDPELPDEVAITEEAASSEESFASPLLQRRAFSPAGEANRQQLADSQPVKGSQIRFDLSEGVKNSRDLRDKASGAEKASPWISVPLVGVRARTILDNADATAEELETVFKSVRPAEIDGTKIPIHHLYKERDEATGHYSVRLPNGSELTVIPSQADGALAPEGVLKAVLRQQTPLKNVLPDDLEHDADGSYLWLNSRGQVASDTDYENGDVKQVPVFYGVEDAEMHGLPHGNRRVQIVSENRVPGTVPVRVGSPYSVDNDKIIGDFNSLVEPLGVMTIPADRTYGRVVNYPRNATPVDRRKLEYTLGLERNPAVREGLIRRMADLPPVALVKSLREDASTLADPAVSAYANSKYALALTPSTSANLGQPGGRPSSVDGALLHAADRIQAAVDAGEMHPDEGAAHIQRIKEQLSLGANTEAITAASSKALARAQEGAQQYNEQMRQNAAAFAEQQVSAQPWRDPTERPEVAPGVALNGERIGRGTLASQSPQREAIANANIAVDSRLRGLGSWLASRAKPQAAEGSARPAPVVGPVGRTMSTEALNRFGGNPVPAGEVDNLPGWQWRNTSAGPLTFGGVLQGPAYPAGDEFTRRSSRRLKEVRLPGLDPQAQARWDALQPAFGMGGRPARDAMIDLLGGGVISAPAGAGVRDHGFGDPLRQPELTTAYEAQPRTSGEGRPNPRSRSGPLPQRGASEAEQTRVALRQVLPEGAEPLDLQRVVEKSPGGAADGLVVGNSSTYDPIELARQGYRSATSQGGRSNPQGQLSIPGLSAPMQARAKGFTASSASQGLPSVEDSYGPQLRGVPLPAVFQTSMRRALQDPGEGAPEAPETPAHLRSAITAAKDILGGYVSPQQGFTGL